MTYLLRHAYREVRAQPAEERVRAQEYRRIQQRHDVPDKHVLVEAALYAMRDGNIIYEPLSGQGCR
jgi:hypothetical protein